MRSLLPFILGIFLLLIHSVAVAQFKSATIGIDGLTCSMCSNSVEKLIRQLDFVKEIKMNLNDAIAQITFKENKDVSIDKLAHKVYDAGYSIRFLKSIYQFDSLYAKNNTAFEYNNQLFSFIKINPQLLTGDHEIQFIGKKFLPKNELERWKELITKKDKNLYYVTF